VVQVPSGFAYVELVGVRSESDSTRECCARAVTIAETRSGRSVTFDSVFAEVAVTGVAAWAFADAVGVCASTIPRLSNATSTLNFNRRDIPEPPEKQPST
jgi:hypothetical protein